MVQWLSHRDVPSARVGIKRRSDGGISLLWQQRFLLAGGCSVDHLPPRLPQLQSVGTTAVPWVLQQDRVVGQLHSVKGLVALPAIVDQHGHFHITDIARDVRFLCQLPASGRTIIRLS